MKHSGIAAFAALTLSLTTGSARAEDEEASKLANRGKALRYDATHSEPTTSKIGWGGAAILVNAPMNQVRQVVTDYRNYEKFIKPFDSSKLISKKNGASEVYLQVPVMHGAAKIWAVVKIAAPVKDGDGEKIVARYVKGNVDDFVAVWRLRPTEDGGGTVLKLELLVDPKLPLPNSMVTGELKYAADLAVTAVRDRLEKPNADKKPSNVAKR